MFSFEQYSSDVATFGGKSTAQLNKVEEKEGCDEASSTVGQAEPVCVDGDDISTVEEAGTSGKNTDMENDGASSESESSVASTVLVEEDYDYWSDDY